MSIPPLVSVCITTYRRPKSLLATLRSVLDQTYGHFELLVVDDASPDNTMAVVQPFLRNDRRVRYERHDSNRGLAAARNTAIREARGKYFTFCDDDDQWEDNFLAEFVSTAEKHDKSWCFCCGNRRWQGGKAVSTIPKQQEMLLADAIRVGYTPPTASQFYFTQTVRDCGGYDERVASGVDHDLWISLSIRNVKLMFIDQCLAFPNKLSAQSSGEGERMTNSYEKRMAGMEASFRIWQDKMIEYYGDDFYEEFVKRYRLLLEFRFLLAHLKSLDMRTATHILVRSDRRARLLIGVLREIFRRAVRRRKQTTRLTPQMRR
jgi:glycosyltransferase involved in cell wall biosynthesis